jgi:hypothetical protein
MAQAVYTLSSSLAWRWKQRIDQRWMAMYQSFAPDDGRRRDALRRVRHENFGRRTHQRGVRQIVEPPRHVSSLSLTAR